ncbi:hypothetical protein CFP65_6650 [Kitasatospora sp. MMS16-BH015]|uniref:DUF4230 domain-containing protein n=1 Tax=Kitasatospora sp. MMS16-BH015 TaxID=2018025 RepID=UPI000CA176CC|nr:DUF4230 domain-containing protein [Kitasatospora sp. MMS16-BH015]AUG81297.1 hypothetical protein CFP65_6650 [Kitasatospora sp. MMS16-BH015]
MRPWSTRRAEPTAPTAPTAPTESTTAGSAAAHRPVAVRRRLPWYFGVPLALAAVLALLLAATRLSLLPSLPDLFGRRTVDRSQPVLLRSIQDMKRLTGAQGNYQVIVDLDQEAKFLPSALLGKRTLYVASGTVDAYTDLSGLGPGAVTVSPDRTTVRLTLPHAQLAPAALDVQRSYVYLQQRGFFDRLGDFFGSAPSSEQPLEVLATQKIGAAAKTSGLADHAEQSARATLEGLLRSLGFTDVTVVTGS